MRKNIFFQVREICLKQYSAIRLRNKGGNGFFRVVDNFAIKADLPSINVKISPFHLP